jgi:hypothetical protein
MATLPRYQQMGIQYADLPRVSTAGIDAAAKSYDVLDQSLDRMIDFAFKRVATEAEKKAKDYAIQNPRTKQQIDDALASGQGTKIPGAGTIFQQTYDKVQAGLLSTELQLEANKAFAAVSATIESGQPFDMGVIQTQIKDMIDGYSSTIMALDADQGLRFKAATTVAGNSVYQTAAKRAANNYVAQQTANFDQALLDVGPVLQTVFETTDSVDPDTGTPIDTEQVIEVLRRPFADSVEIFGDAKYLTGFNKKVREMKVNALVSVMSDRSKFTSAPDAIAAIDKGDFGAASPLYQGLSQEEKQKVSDDVLKSFANEYTASQRAKQLESNKNKEAWTTLSLEYLNPNTSSARKRQITSEGVRLNQITLQQAQDMLKPPGEKTDLNLYNSLYDKIQRGQITSFQDLIQYQSRLSDSDYKSLATAATNTQGKTALKNIRMFIGIRENQFVAEDKHAKEAALTSLYTEELGKQVPNSQGVLVYQTPTQAADAAIERFKTNKPIQDALAAQDRIKARIEKFYQDAGLAMPNVPIENIDLNTIKDRKLREDIGSQQKSYRDSVRGMSGQ